MGKSIIKRKNVAANRGAVYNSVRADIARARELAGKVRGRGLLRNLRPIVDELAALAARLGK